MIAGAPTRFALDASALLAAILGEPGQERVVAVLDEAYIHAVNLAEVVGKLVRTGIPCEEAESSIRELNVAVDEEFAAAEALEVGKREPAGRRLGLGLGDRVCLVAAEWNRAEAVLTTDRSWLEAASAVKIQVIR